MGMFFMILFWALGIAIVLALLVWLIGRLRR